MPRVMDWLEQVQPDVVCLQETKCTDMAFPSLEFAQLGYESAHHGNGRWNGVAVISKLGLSEVGSGFGTAESDDGRIIGARCGHSTVISVYVPNGRSVGSEQYQAKLAWLEQLRRHLEAGARRSDEVVVCGDFNVAPEDRDVWDPKAFVGATHVSEAERAALQRVEEWGLVDAFRLLYPQDGLFTWWDYRAGSFHKRQGMRIDLMLVTASLAGRVRWATVDRNARKGTLPSDHAPLLVDFDDPA
jgi:exodeoxyribonuclease III